MSPTAADRPDPAERGLATRFLFEAGDAMSLAAQWQGRRSGKRPILALVRTIAEDPAGIQTLTTLWPDLRLVLAEIEVAWAAAELAASASLIGLALGGRVSIVPMDGRWTTELVSVTTRHRMPLGPGRSTPRRALESAYDVLASSFGSTGTPS